MIGVVASETKVEENESSLIAIWVGHVMLEVEEGIGFFLGWVE